MANVAEFNEKNFEQEVLQAEVPVFVDFWAPWCGPCRMVGPVVEEIAAEFAGRVKVGKMNVDENGKIAQQYGVMSIPTMIIVKGGQEVSRIVGFRPQKDIAKELEKFL